MDSSGVPVFLAGPFPVIYSAHVDPLGSDVELDIGLIIGGLPTLIASTRFPLDETWERIEAALTSGDARLGVAGVRYAAKSTLGTPEYFPSAYVGLECANGERLVLAHIRGLDPEQDPELYAREVMQGIQNGHTPPELGEIIDDE